MDDHELSRRVFFCRIRRTFHWFAVGFWSSNGSSDVMAMVSQTISMTQIADGDPDCEGVRWGWKKSLSACAKLPCFAARNLIEFEFHAWVALFINPARRSRGLHGVSVEAPGPPRNDRGGFCESSSHQQFVFSTSSTKPTTCRFSSRVLFMNTDSILRIPSNRRWCSHMIPWCGASYL